MRYPAEDIRFKNKPQPIVQQVPLVSNVYQDDDDEEEEEEEENNNPPIIPCMLKRNSNSS